MPGSSNSMGEIQPLHQQGESDYYNESESDDSKDNDNESDSTTGVHSGNVNDTRKKKKKRQPSRKRQGQTFFDAHTSSAYQYYTPASKRRIWGIGFMGMVGIISSFRGSAFVWARFTHLEGLYMNYMQWVHTANTTATTTSIAVTDNTDTQADTKDVYVRTITTKFGKQLNLKQGWRAPGELRFDWSNLPVQSQLAKEFLAHQTNCELPLLHFRNRNNAGMGSDLHVYGMALCNAHRRHARMFTPFPWMYWDEQNCAKAMIPKSQSSMSCYFPQLELQCPNDQVVAQQLWNESEAKWLRGDRNFKRVHWETHEDMSCASVLRRPGYAGLFKIFDVRAAISELVFSHVSPVLLEEAKRQHALIFRQHGAPPPHQMISCHVRWGDKGREMALQPIQSYVQAVKQVADQHNLPPHETHVFLATEDPRAVDAFKHAAHPDWTIYLDQFYVEMLPYRNNQTQEVAGAAKAGFGRTGLLALGSMLVTMESNMYILSTGSNWSRLMNELRKNSIRPRCHWKGQSTSNRTDVDCTALIDVQPSGSQYETGSTSRVSQHHLIMQKLNAIRAQNQQGGGASRGHGAINYGANVKPESITRKEEHYKTVKYPRLQKRNRGPGRRHHRHLRLMHDLMKGNYTSNCTRTIDDTRGVECRRMAVQIPFVP